MQIITTRNVHRALPIGIIHMESIGVERNSRNGRVREMPWPVATVYSRPDERVMFHVERDANPFFHFFEGLWMLAGRRDVEFVSKFNTNMMQYSDNGITFNGAYGYRWRNHFGADQLGVIVHKLAKNPDDRRAVLAIYDGTDDTSYSGADVPCNLAAHFYIRAGKMTLQVFCRSNDMVWGAYGANAVHMSMLQEYVARAVGVEIGTYIQISSSFHAYMNEQWDLIKNLLPEDTCPYTSGEVEPYPMMVVGQQLWDRDLKLFFEDQRAYGYEDPFFQRVVQPLWFAWKAWKMTGMSKDARIARAQEVLEQCAAKDWKKAASEWLNRRLEK